MKKKIVANQLNKSSTLCNNLFLFREIHKMPAFSDYTPQHTTNVGHIWEHSTSSQMQTTAVFNSIFVHQQKNWGSSMQKLRCQEASLREHDHHHHKSYSNLIKASPTTTSSRIRFDITANIWSSSAEEDFWKRKEQHQQDICALRRVLQVTKSKLSEQTAKSHGTAPQTIHQRLQCGHRPSVYVLDSSKFSYQIIRPM